jgi:4-carboxymuconolactone decarboxylase
MSTLVSRIQEIPEDKLTAEQAQVFKDLVAGRGRLLTPYKIWIHSPKLAAAMERIGTFLNNASSLNEREVELVICLIAHHWKGAYVFAAHEKRCLELGYPKAVIDAIRADKAPDLTDRRERTVYEVAQIAMAPGAGSDETFERAVAVIGHNGVAEVIALLGYYSAVAMAMKTYRVPIPGR